MTTPLDQTLEPSATARFSDTVRLATRADHQDAEASPFVADLLAGTLPVEGYAALLGQLWFVYDALERAGEALRTDPVAGRFVFDALLRGPALEADLSAVVGDDWRSQVDALPATAAYADRLAEVGRTWPGGFVAHHYTRYLGDLSGGRLMGRVVRDTYGFDDRRGASFFAFDAIDQPNRFKIDYRTLLDEAPWSPDEQEAIVEEVRVAFRCNRAVFSDLAGSVASA